MQIVTTKHFTKKAGKLDAKIRAAFIERIRLFQNEPFHPLLNNHALRGGRKDQRSINITGDCVPDGGGDVCPNLPGNQSSVPSGYSLNAAGDCVSDDTPPGEPLTCIDQVPESGRKDCLGAKPLLLRKGEATTLSWNVPDANSCRIDASNGTFWPALGRSGSFQSRPIREQVVFRLECTRGSESVNDSKTVNVLPEYNEE